MPAAVTHCPIFCPKCLELSRALGGEMGRVRLKRGQPMPRMRVLMRPAVWIVYVVIVFEILFMISPFALHFYAAYGPMLNVLHAWPGTAWMTKFYFHHFTVTTSPIMKFLYFIGLILFVSGFTMCFSW